MKEEKIDTLVESIQTIIDSDTKSKNQLNELEKKFNNLQNSLYNPLSDFTENPDETKAFDDYLRKGTTSDIIVKSLSTIEGEAGVAIVHDLNKKIINALNAKSVMRQLASIETISTSALDLILEDGNFTSGWIGEAAERVVSDSSKLKKKTIFVHELYAQPKATQKLIDDSAIDLNSWLSERLSDSFIKAENEAFISGDGDKKPFGLLSNGDIEKVQAEAKVTTEFLLHLINKLPEEHLNNASFLMNRSTLAAIQGLKDDTGRFIWQQSLSDPLKQSIFGIPVFCSSHMPNIAEDNLAIAVGDFKTAYKIVDRSGIGIMRDPYTEKPFVKFYAVKRVGGDVVVPSAIKFAKFSA